MRVFLFQGEHKWYYISSPLYVPEKTVHRVIDLNLSLGDVHPNKQ